MDAGQCDEAEVLIVDPPRKVLQAIPNPSSKPSFHSHHIFSMLNSIMKCWCGCSVNVLFVLDGMGIQYWL